MSYGDYILSTGGGRVGATEVVFGRFLYEREFVGRVPVLDLAAGRCWFAKQNPAEIHAVDLAPEIVAHYAAEDVQITEGSAYAIPHDDGFFAAVFCCWLFEHLDDPDRAMREIHRVLKPGGMCFLVVPSAHQLTRGFYDDYTHVRPFTPASLHQLATFNGFREARPEYLAHMRVVGRLLPILGAKRLLAYMHFSDRWLRRVGLVNRNMLTLTCYR